MDSGCVTRVGLVVVHGIGDQHPGDTGREVLDGLDAVTGKPDTDDPPWSRENPAREHVMVRRRPISASRDVELLVVDAWWDDVVEMESGLRRRLRIWLWGLRIVPFMLQLSGAAGMVAAMQRAEHRTARQPTAKWESYATTMTGLPRREWGWLLRGFHSALLRFLVLPPIVLAGLLVLPPLLQAADWMWRMASRAPSSPPGRILDLVLLLTCGDAWAFVSDPQRRERILRRVRETVEWTDSRCDSVVLIGHSQGGAISRAVLSAGTRADHLITVGSGANLLGALFNTIRKPQVSAISWLMLLGYPALIATLLTWFVQDVATYTGIFLGTVRDAFAGRPGPPGISNDFFRIESRSLFLIIGLLLILGVARLAMGRIRFDPSTLRPPIASWWDISSPYDPVCVGGHLMETDVHGVDVVNSTKLRELPVEHTTYFRNPAVAGVIAAVLASAGSSRQVDPEIPSPAGGARWHHTLTRYWWWGLPITLGATLVVTWSYQWLLSVFLT